MGTFDSEADFTQGRRIMLVFVELFCIESASAALEEAAIEKVKPGWHCRTGPGT